MSTIFDFLTVASFAGIVFAYFKWGGQDLAVLLRLSIAALVLAVANQLGNAQLVWFAALLFIAALVYAFAVLRRWC